MSQNAVEVPVWKKGLVYTMPGADAVTVRQDLRFAGSDGGILPMDVYLPPGSESSARLPATVELTICAMLFALLISFPMAICAALYHGRSGDRASCLGGSVQVLRIGSQNEPRFG